MVKRLLLPFTALVMLLSGVFSATPAHAATQYTVTADPISTVPGGAPVTITGHVTPAPPAEQRNNLWIDATGLDGTYYSHIAETTVKPDGTWTITTIWGAGTPGLMTIRAAYNDPADNWWRDDYQYFARDNHVTLTTPAPDSTARTGDTLTLTGTTYPARTNDEITIDVIDSANHYIGGVAHTATRADGSWSTTISATYPTGKLQIRAANYNGWWARTEYSTINLT